MNYAAYLPKMQKVDSEEVSGSSQENMQGGGA